MVNVIYCNQFKCNAEKRDRDRERERVCDSWFAVSSNNQKIKEKQTDVCQYKAKTH